jgi:hypothetical protein
MSSNKSLHSFTSKIIKPLIHALFGGSLLLAGSAYFEQCLDNGVPIWSTVLGAPFLHHGYYGFILAIAAYMGLTVIYERRNHN